ncbi:DUF7218 family protein [Zhihengliuella flava]|uniref:Rho termination factor-like N-terminal domain-containing protein n=1 Tax=Zhihengliuella flava TaxID=1285193 RepID=A0A931GF11_9MICC|nr:Rho termination factor N-terminal domain-containing protein [Zhihengliuella flava]MBG6084918.1 hypothetical protein [Zhihengliuella flava]
MPRQERDDTPQIKDQELYESLRDEGESKSKAARIANAAARDGRDTVGERGGSSPSYEDWTVDELRDRAREIGLSGYSDLRKDDLIDALRNS